MKFEGGDGEETLVFKSAALGKGATGRHTIELSAVDDKSEKVTVILCILNDTVSQKIGLSECPIQL